MGWALGITGLAGGVAVLVFWLLWRSASKKLVTASRENGMLKRSNEQFQSEIEQGQKRIRDVVERTERALREKRREAQRLVADSEAMVLAGADRPAVVGALAISIERLFELSEAEATVDYSRAPPVHAPPDPGTPSS